MLENKTSKLPAFSQEIANFLSPDCHHMEISEHNHLALLGKTGIEVVSLNSSTLSKHIICRYFIKVSTKHPLENILKRPHNEFMWKLGFSSMSKIALQPESLGLLQRKPTIPSVVDYKFSPPYHNICFLASVTSTGVLTIYQKICNQWIICCDLSDICLDDSSKHWTNPKTESEWHQILEEGQIVRVCWVLADKQLYILATFKNGDVVIYSISYKKSFKTKFVAKIKGESSNPTSIYTFSLGKNLIIVQGFYSGVVRCNFFSIESGDVIRNEMLSKEDFVQCHQILHIILESCVKIVVNKRKFISIYNVSLTDSQVSLKQIVLEQPILYICINSDSNTLSAYLLDMSVVDFSLSTMTEVKRNCGLVITSGGGVVTSSNNYLRILALKQKENNVQISIFPIVSDEPRQLLRTNCENGVKLTQFMDLLWMYKVEIIKSIKSVIEESESMKWGKLRYWELTLLYNDQLIDEETRSKVLEKLNQIEHDLVSASNSPYFAKFRTTLNQPDYVEKCPVCGESASLRNVAMLCCNKGHSMPRCCVTFQPCLPIEFVSCSTCPAKINLPLPDKMTLETLVCPFCDGFFEEHNLLAAQNEDASCQSLQVR